GDSGIGKSSICRAGVLPLVAQGALGTRRWQIVTWIPGRGPLTSVSEALATGLGMRREEVRQLLERDPAQLVRELVVRLGASRGLLLFADQLEELATQSPPGEAQ